MIVLTSTDARADINTPWHVQTQEVIDFKDTVASNIEMVTAADQKSRSVILKFRTVEAFITYISNPIYVQYVLERSVYNINNNIAYRVETAIVAD